MLAIQRPSMGSSKPPDFDMPFGYAFDSTSNFPYPSPTAPAPGPSLLDDNESKFLDNFFEGVSSDLNYDFFSNPPDGSELGLGWNEVPPAFMGSTTSFGQQPQHAMPPGLNFGDMNSQMNNAPQAPPTTSADLLAASILQNAPNGRSQSIGNELLFRGQDMSLQATNGHVRPQSISHYPQSRSNTATRELPVRDDFMRDSFYTDMVFGSQTAESPLPRQASQAHSKADIRWGSDTGFSAPEGFVPPITQQKEVAKMDYPFKVMEVALEEVLSSTDNTRPPSPSLTRDTREVAVSISVPKKPRFTGKINYDEELDMDLRPRKRRKNSSKFQDDDDEGDESGSGKQGKKRKPAKRSDSPSSEQNSKRRKSAANAAKATRENLTEDQKRENHIKSEQKRRTLIREGFEDLGELVPGLRGGGFSKSAVLIMSADWLEELLQGNELLRQRLDQMQGR